MKKLIAGNWKMHGSRDCARALAAAVADQARKTAPKAEVLICPPSVFLAEAAAAIAGSPVLLGAQDCRAESEGAFTGDVSAAMLKDLGCSYVILGHSERRAHYAERSDAVRAKASAVIASGLTPIICVGETLEIRERGGEEAFVAAEARDSVPNAPSMQFVLAYEPVWAIGTGKTPSLSDISRMHVHLKSLFADVRILYGGSVKASNAAEILKIQGVDGALVGGASLKAEEFAAIVDAA